MMWYYQITHEDWMGPIYGPYDNYAEAERLAQLSADYCDLHRHRDSGHVERKVWSTCS